MCRYAFKPYSCRWACFSCRKAFKHHGAGDEEAFFFGHFPDDHEPRKCPECGGPTYDIGKDTRPPRKQNKKEWKKLELLHQQGFNFESCGCRGPGIPKNLASITRNQKTGLSLDKRKGRW
jgi:hypothetical protein